MYKGFLCNSNIPEGELPPTQTPPPLSRPPRLIEQLLSDATRIAYRELVRWLAKDFKFDTWDIYMILSQVGKVRLGNFVDPKYTVGAGIEKKYLK